jgi:hypothetical protein
MVWNRICPVVFYINNFQGEFNLNPRGIAAKLYFVLYLWVSALFMFSFINNLLHNLYTDRITNSYRIVYFSSVIFVSPDFI